MAAGKYKEWLEPDGLLRIEAWARDGLSKEQVAHNMGIATSTLREWVNTYPAISTALKRGKEIVDIEVENAMCKRHSVMSMKKSKLLSSKRLMDQGKLRWRRPRNRLLLMLVLRSFG